MVEVYPRASYMCMLSFKSLKQRYQIRENLSRKHDVNDKGQYLTTAIITKASINNSLRSIYDHQISKPLNYLKAQNKYVYRKRFSR